MTNDRQLRAEPVRLPHALDAGGHGGLIVLEKPGRRRGYGHLQSLEQRAPLGNEIEASGERGRGADLAGDLCRGGPGGIVQTVQGPA